MAWHPSFVFVTVKDHLSPSYVNDRRRRFLFGHNEKQDNKHLFTHFIKPNECGIDTTFSTLPTMYVCIRFGMTFFECKEGHPVVLSQLGPTLVARVFSSFMIGYRSTK